MIKKQHDKREQDKKQRQCSSIKPHHFGKLRSKKTNHLIRLHHSINNEWSRSQLFNDITAMQLSTLWKPSFIRYRCWQCSNSENSNSFLQLESISSLSFIPTMRNQKLWIQCKKSCATAHTALRKFESLSWFWTNSSHV